LARGAKGAPKNATFALHTAGAAMSGLNDRATTVRRGVAADLLQVQQRAIYGSINDCTPWLTCG
jgi:hypothetical protein